MICSNILLKNDLSQYQLQKQSDRSAAAKYHTTKTNSSAPLWSKPAPSLIGCYWSSWFEMQRFTFLFYQHCEYLMSLFNEGDFRILTVISCVFYQVKHLVFLCSCASDKDQVASSDFNSTSCAHMSCYEESL